MKLLLDENLHSRIKKLIHEHAVYTVQEMGWSGKENGELLKLILEKQFDALITADKNIDMQQNLKKYEVSVILLKVKSLALENFLPLPPKLEKVLKGKLKLGLTIIE